MQKLRGCKHPISGEVTTTNELGQLGQQRSVREVICTHVLVTFERGRVRRERTVRTVFPTSSSQAAPRVTAGISAGGTD